MWMSVEDQMYEWSSVWSGKVPSKLSPAQQLLWPALNPSLLYRPAVLVSCVLPGADQEANPRSGGEVSDRKVIKIISSNYSRIVCNIFYFQEPLPRPILLAKTTVMCVAVYLPVLLDTWCRVRLLELRDIMDTFLLMATTSRYCLLLLNLRSNNLLPR